MNRNAIVLDTNAAIFLIAHKEMFPSVKEALDGADVFVSVITRIEILAKPDMTGEEMRKILGFLAEVTVVPLDAPVEAETILLRRSKLKPKPLLPDAIIAATAKVLNAVLFTNDTGMLKLSWPGLAVRGIF